MASKSDSKLKKHLPKRCMNDNLKARRAASWARGEAKKAARRAEQAKRERKNKERRALGEPTPHESKKLARKS